MIQENELITFLLALGTLLFLLVNLPRLRRVPGHRWMVAAFVAFFVGWTLTILEEFFRPDLLNVLEHVAYAVSSLLLGIWVFRFPGRAWGDRP